MESSRLVRAFRLVSETMGRSRPDALLPWLEGEPARVAEAAAADPPPPEPGPAPVHPSWLVEPLSWLPPTVRAPSITLLDPEVARLAALAMEGAAGEEMATRAGTTSQAESARSFMASIITVPPPNRGTGREGGGHHDIRRLMARIEQTRLDEEIEKRWPDETHQCRQELLQSLGEKRAATASALTAIAACFADSEDDSIHLAQGLARPVGSCLMRARRRFWRILDPDTARQLHLRLLESV